MELFTIVLAVGLVVASLVIAGTVIRAGMMIAMAIDMPLKSLSSELASLDGTLNRSLRSLSASPPEVPVISPEEQEQLEHDFNITWQLTHLSHTLGKLEKTASAATTLLQSALTRTLPPPRHGTPITSMTDLAVGDLIVHENLGIGRYLGHTTLDVGGHVLQNLQFEGVQGRFPPVFGPEGLNLISKYLGAEPPHGLSR